MRKCEKNHFKLLPVTAAILLIYGNAYAEITPEIVSLTTPESSVNLGVGAFTGGSDTKRFSQYTGLGSGTSILQDIELIKRDNEAGLWTEISARNIGLETRELKVLQQKQGSWKYTIDYNEIVRLDPYVIHTGMTGVGTTTPTINLIETPSMPSGWATANGLAASNGVQGHDVELKLKRTAYGLSGDKWLTPELQLLVALRSEDKKGARMFGRVGMSSIQDMQSNPDATGASPYGGWAVLLTPEPIDTKTSSIETKLNFKRDNLALTVGYHGSFFVNNFGNLSPNVPGTLNRGILWTNCATVGCSTVQQLASAPVALPPDNQSHQYFLSGSYAFSNTTRSNFKLAYTSASQNESFTGMGLTPSATAPGSLGGIVNTTLAQVGLTMRPLKDLSLNANMRYEDRADNTPIYVYNNNGIAGSPLNATTNWPSGSQTRTTAKLDGIYRLLNGYSILLGIDWERKKTPLPPANTAIFSNKVFFRPELSEAGMRTEFRKSVSETLNGAVGLEYKERRGNDSEWVTTSGTAGNALIGFAPGATGGNYILPNMYMDRNRSKLRGNIDWDATDKLSWQALVEHTQDDFLRAFPGSITPAQIVPVNAGARTIISDSATLDATLRISEAWKMNAYWTQSYSRWNVNRDNLGSETRSTEDTVGLSVNGKASAKWTLGLDILSTQNISTFDNVVATAVATAAENLPAIQYRTDSMNLRGKYAIDKASDLLLGYKFQQFTTDDWQWGYNGTPFLYSDNTTVSQPMNQVVRFLSASYYLRF
jgi:MtrB/PioB family decaheme-associated outer membrane protein